MTNIVYADNHASTPIDPEVASAMWHHMCYWKGNPSSIEHVHGLAMAMELEKCRIFAAKFINAESPENIIFTSGSTESNNLAILGTCYKGSIAINNPIEHKSVLSPIAQSCSVQQNLVLNHDFTIDLDDLVKVKESSPVDISMISCMAANNEIGTKFQIHELGRFCRQFRVNFHCDATQVAAWEKIDVQRDAIDFLSLSSHKVYGPAGVGLLYLKNPERLPNMWFGGKQEFGKRPGTQNILGIVGFTKALELAEKYRSEDSEKIALYRSKMEKNFLQNFRHLEFQVNGGENRLPNNLSITFYGLQQGLLELINKRISVSSGSACQGGESKISHVIEYLGHPQDSQTLRIGLGRFTTEEDVNVITETIIDAVDKLS